MENENKKFKQLRVPVTKEFELELKCMKAREKALWPDKSFNLKSYYSQLLKLGYDERSKIIHVLESTELAEKSGV